MFLGLDAEMSPNEADSHLLILTGTPGRKNKQQLEQASLHNCGAFGMPFHAATGQRSYWLCLQVCTVQQLPATEHLEASSCNCALSTFCISQH